MPPGQKNRFSVSVLAIGITKGQNTEGCDRLKLADASQDTSSAAVQCIGLEPTKYRYVILQFTGEEAKVQVLNGDQQKHCRMVIGCFGEQLACLG